VRCALCVAARPLGAAPEEKWGRPGLLPRCARRNDSASLTGAAARRLSKGWGQALGVQPLALGVWGEARFAELLLSFRVPRTE
jgi:hypothetical protein